MRHIGNCTAEDAGETPGQGQRESGEVLSVAYATKWSQQAQIRSDQIIGKFEWGLHKGFAASVTREAQKLNRLTCR